jgi:hypothetical protein
MKTRLLVFLAFCSAAMAGDLSRLCADRAAIERVYYNHRLGEKPAFEQALPRETLEQLVRLDLRKESALKRVYGEEVTPTMVEAEVQRINSTTRAPEALAELKAALDNDPARFARTVARPIVVERELRRHFDNDDQLHASQRRQAEQARGELLAAKSQGASVSSLVALLRRDRTNQVSETTWQLGPRPAETNAAEADLVEAQKRFGPNAKILSPQRAAGREQKFYFADLPTELQNVLRVQLRRPGDVSAVIETPGGFLLYVAMEKTEAVLSVSGLSLPKRGYESWLAEQAGENP